MELSETASQNKIEEIRAHKRQETNERRKKRIHDLLTIKRKWTVEDDSKVEISQEQVLNFTNQLKKHKRIEILKYLSDAFSFGEENITAFLSVDGALYSLIGCLIGKDVDLKLASVVCLINLGTGSHKTTSLCIKAAAAYLLAYLGNGNYELQELCVWALGNFAADCENCSGILNKQGFIPAVIKLLNSPNEKVEYSAYFALACYTHTRRNKIDEDLLNHETLSLISHPLISTRSNSTMSECASIIFHLTCSGKNDLNLMSAGIMDKISFQLANCLQNQPDAIMVITPLTRSLANLCSGEVNVINYCISKPEIPIILHSLLQSRYSHIIKESLWLLSNILSCNEGIIIIQDLSLLQRVADLSENIGPISLQALICLCNIAAISKQQCQVLISAMSIMTKIQRLLQRSDVNTIKSCLTLMALLIENCSLSKVEICSLCNNCLIIIHILKCHENEDIRRFCNIIIEKLN